MELSEIREKIDAVDEQLLDLFLQRMDLSDEVAAYKNAHHLPILNKERERAILAKVTEKSGERVCLPPVLHPVRAGPVPAGRADLRPHQGGRPSPRLSGGRYLGLSPDGPGGLSGRGGGQLPGGL